MANNFFAKLQQGLSKTRDNIARGFDNVFSGFSSIDEDFYEELEETLIMADIGVNATSRVMDELRKQVKEKKISDPNACRELLTQILREQMHTDDNAYDFEDKKTIIFVIGVNGVGKTTSVGKLASIFKNKGKKVLIAAADTYRAAATEQLQEWAKRADAPIIVGKEGADPASVIYDAASSFKARGCDILIVDTAGRLHNKKNLMEELAKMNRIIDKELPGIWRENFIVLDGTTGQNAIMQAREFGEAADLTGIVLTKLDGTAKGGIAVAIVSELNIPVKYVGVGEGIDDLERFNSDEFVDALM
ncbi:fused signal recognition particle receptor [Butyrivibrio proteoclasticus]|uniref:Signal recognition particle receptor FtsY n=1 Tax=Butyrivibrio proteoclasticus TaxID=43305 RepID=A0A1I5U390_9FIRM|nr:signal recognition particle-docking protein FtsY [Butyrivibrio proteoclasticus]SFP89337.1 fused signal recognition particle receptor [Butyrivibrio proteoclasticus]